MYFDQVADVCDYRTSKYEANSLIFNASDKNILKNDSIPYKYFKPKAIISYSKHF